MGQMKTSIPQHRRPILEVEDLRISFIRNNRKHPVVDGISYQLESGTTLAIVGESGAGKTLSCLALLGLLPRRAIISGAARFESVNLLTLPERRMRRYRSKHISMVFQDPASALNPIMKVGYQIAEVIHEHGASWKEAKWHAIDYLDRLGFHAPAHSYHSYPHQLSGGMQQRIMIAVALAGKPRILIADEATKSLDLITQAQVIEFIAALQKVTGMATIIISHDLRLAEAYANDVLVMKSGQIVERGTASAVIHHSKMPYTKELMQASRVDGRVLKRSKLAKSQFGQTNLINDPHKSLSPVLHAIDLIQQYQLPRSGRARRTPAPGLVEASLAIAAGETVGLVGESGAGKSTLARALILEPKPHSGSVLLNGTDLMQLTSRQVAARRQKIQMVFQDPYNSLNPIWNVRSIVAEPLTGRGGMAPVGRRQRVRELLDTVGLSDKEFGGRRPGTLSGGQAQRVAIARALAPWPQLIILDEAFSSLDATTRFRMIKLVRHLRETLNIAFLFISHDLTQVEAICDRVAVMRDGRILEIGSTSKLFSSPAHPYSAKLLASIPKSIQRINIDTGILTAPPKDELQTASSTGCGFRSQCPRSVAKCALVLPTLQPLGRHHAAACHFPNVFQL